MKIVDLQSEKTEVKKILEKAIKENLESVMLFGIKDGRYKVMGTGMHDRLRVIGFLEAAKVEMWAGDTT